MKGSVVAIVKASRGNSLRYYSTRVRS